MSEEQPNLFPSRRLALVRCSSMILERLMQLPAGSSIVDVRWDFGRQDCVFVITGPTMPVVHYGDEISWIVPTVRVDLKSGRGDVVEWPAS